MLMIITLVFRLIMTVTIVLRLTMTMTIVLRLAMTMAITTLVFRGDSGRTTMTMTVSVIMSPTSLDLLKFIMNGLMSLFFLVIVNKLMMLLAGFLNLFNAYK